MTASERPEILPYLVAVLAVIGIVLLTALGDKVPDILNIIAGGATIGGAAISTGRSAS